MKPNRFLAATLWASTALTLNLARAADQPPVVRPQGMEVIVEAGQPAVAVVPADALR